MGTGKKALAIGVGGILGLLALLLALASIVNWNAARPWLAERVAEATGRSFAIRGDLEVRWQTPAHMYTDWRRHIPWPHFRAHEVLLGNPEWAKTGPIMLAVPQLDFTLNPFGLLRRNVTIPTLLLTEPRLALEIDEHGENNWTFAQGSPQGGSQGGDWNLVLKNLFLNDGTVRLLNRERPADVTARVQTRADGAIAFTVQGDVGGSAVRGGGQTGSLLALGEDAAFPVNVHVTIGETEISIDGTATNPRQPSAIDMVLSIEGASMAELFPFTGIALPHTPRFSTRGRLVGSLKREDFLLRYEDFSGKVGSSDLAGTLEYLRREPRPLLRGRMVSQRLDLGDLGTTLGTAEEAKGKVLPERKFATDRWDEVDLQLEFAGKRIVRGKDLPIEDVRVKADLRDGVLRLSPLNFGFAGGTFMSDLTLAATSDPPKARLNVRGRGIRLRELFPDLEDMPATIGEASVNAELSAAGASIAGLAGAADGEVRAFMHDGTISKLALEAIGLNLGSVIVAKLFGDRQVQVNCLASDFAVKDGVMHARTFVVDTEDGLIQVNGDIDLGKEALALAIHPESKGPRVLALDSPLYVGGTLADPRIGVDAGALGLQAGAAAVLGVLAAPLAALTALIDPGDETDEASPCPKALARAQQAPDAPPPNAK